MSDALRTLVLYASSPENATLSYQRGWPKFLAEHPGLDCTMVNVQDYRWAARGRAVAVAAARRFDAIVMLHSVFSNSCNLLGPLRRVVRASRALKAYFVGNEYKLMPEKMAFCEELGVGLLVSQSEDPAIHDLYRARLGCRVAGIPNTGLDADVFRPTTDRRDRPIDLGYRAYDPPPYVGHNERRELAEGWLKRGPEYGLALDISMEERDRFDTDGWAAFLNRCKGQLGSEAGGDCFELTDATRLAVNRFFSQNPGVGFEEVRRRFFSGPPKTSLRVISGRHVEAAGTKTVQILFEGHYSGYIRPDEHYIPLRKDFSNVDEVVEKFRDEAFCRKLADNAYEVAHRKLRYEVLVERFRQDLQAALLETPGNVPASN